MSAALFALPDVNVLLAMAWPNHLHHNAAHQWYAQNRERPWASCMHTQMGFVRLSMQPAIVGTAVSFADAARVLSDNLGIVRHEFWPLNFGIAEIRPEIRTRLMGHQQLADAVLLELAIRSGGTLVTFDRRISRLLPEDSPHQSALELIQA